MGKTGDLFKKIGDTTGKFHTKMGTIKHRHGKDVTEADTFKNSGEEYTDELCTKDLHDPVKHNGVITQLEPDVLECEVKQYFRNITTNKALGGDGIQLSSFNSKRLCCECAALHRPANLGNAAVARGLEEVSFHFNHNKRQS